MRLFKGVVFSAGALAFCDIGFQRTDSPFMAVGMAFCIFAFIEGVAWLNETFGKTNEHKP